MSKRPLSENSKQDIDTPFDGVLKLVEAYHKLLLQVKSDHSAVDDLGKLLGNLRRLSVPEREVLLASKRSQGTSFLRNRTPDVPEDIVIAMTIGDVLGVLENTETTRHQLERIASLRFGMSRGAISPLPKEALIEKMRTLAEHESTHASIARAAGINSSRRSVGEKQDELVASTSKLSSSSPDSPIEEDKNRS